jgi:hypothetical protein
MTSTRNGSHGNPSTRRLRFDSSTGRPASRPAQKRPSPHSGRRFVTVAVVSVLILWGVLYFTFRDWRVRFRERAFFGKSQVATAVDPLARIVPHGVDPGEWRQAVDDTHALLVRLTGSNILDLSEMKALRNELSARAARATPGTARAELTAIWDDLQHRAGPILDPIKYPRPKLLAVPKAKIREAPAKKN